MYIEDDADLEAVLASLGQVNSEPLVLERIFDGQADHDRTFALINRYERSNPYHGLGFKAGQWFETTQEIYWELLECMSPLHMTSSCFVLSEETLGGLHEAFFEIDGRFFCAVVRWAGPRSVSDLWSALLTELGS